MADRASDPRWQAGFAAGEEDRRAGTDLGERLDGSGPPSFAWWEGYQAARHADDRLSSAPPGWPTLLAVAAAGAWVDSLSRGTRSWRDPRRALGFAVSMAMDSAATHSGRARAARRGIRRQGDLPEGFAGMHVFGPVVAVTAVRLAWWRVRGGRGRMPDRHLTWSRSFARRIIIAGVMRREWDRRMLPLRR
ncbi:MAG: hypothetical protein JHC84_18420 [Solirubrobacteraceae bacterium]|nr:hypothetical protein [Solirubrobacteraceae bacterium]